MPANTTTASVPLIPRRAAKKRDITTEAENLLSGLTIDGRRAARRFSFSAHQGVRRQAVNLACDVMESFHARAPEIYDNDDARAGILRKLFIHLVRSRRQTEPTIWVFSRHALEAVKPVAESATPLNAPMYYAAVLRLTTPALPVAKLQLPAGKPARPVLWRSNNGMFRLEELTHPFHVMAEGFALRHCIDSLYVKDREYHGVTSATFASAHYLHYWRSIQERRSRIFSFGDADGPLVTISLKRCGNIINQLGPRKGSGISHEDVYFPYLIQAILHLSRLHPPLCVGGDDFFPWSAVLTALDGKPGITISQYAAYTRVQRIAKGLL